MSAAQVETAPAASVAGVVSRPGASAARAAEVALALAVGPALAVAHTPAQAAGGHEAQRFGVAPKGKNHGAAGALTSCAGLSTGDHQGNARKLVPKDTCVQVVWRTSPTGFGQFHEKQGRGA